jgi:hypothetical protein
MAEEVQIKKITPVSPKVELKEEKKAPAKTAAKKTEAKSTAKKPAAKAAPAKTTATKTVAKKEAAPAKKEVTVVKSSDGKTLLTIAEDQMNGTRDVVVSAMTTFGSQIDEAREAGSGRAKAIIDGLHSSDNKVVNMIGDAAGIAGEVVAVGVTLSATPMAVMAGTAKGIYNRVKA